MGKQSQARKGTRPRKIGKNDSIVGNKVHELIAYIESRFSGEHRQERGFAAAALAGALRFLDEISDADGISKQRKIALLTRVYEVANSKIEAFLRETPNVPLWKDRRRSDWRMSPCTFVERYYPTYGNGLTSDDIKDRNLLKALQNFKARYGWPDGFDLPTKSQALDRLVEAQGSSIDLKGLADVPPRVRRERERAWHARYRRLGK
jgi:hypothetical protein